jgi:hypothetical protein
VGLNEKMKVVTHDAKAEDIDKIDGCEEFEEFEENFFVCVSNGQPLQGGS